LKRLDQKRRAILVFRNLLEKGMNALLDTMEPYFVNINDLQYQYERQQKIEPGVRNYNFQDQERVLSSPQYSNSDGKRLERIFDSIIGLSDLKEILIRCLVAEEPTNVLLSGPPASAKTLFLLAIHKEMTGCYFVDAANSSGAGMVDYLFAHPETQILLIDELDKLSKKDQTTLLNLLETGILTSNKVRKTAQQKMNIKVFATSNDIERISKPLRSRLLEFHLNAYTYEEFSEIAVNLLAERYGHDSDLSITIANAIWYEMQSKDIRNVIAIGKLAHVN
jgi:Holliday junction DNA helicase RuvB